MHGVAVGENHTKKSWNHRPGRYNLKQESFIHECLIST